MSSYGLWLSAAGMKVQQHRQTLYANNLANAKTTGFKHDMAVVTQRQIESREDVGGFPFSHPVLDGLAGGVNIRPPFQNFSQGSIERTDRPLDVAIEGDGFFAVSDGTATRYTRDGEFTTNQAGELVLASASGRWRVLEKGGSPITLDPSGAQVTISSSGTVRQGKVVVGSLAVMTTADKQALRKVGENLFDAGELEMTPVNATLRPGAREESNFEIMSGLAGMIEATRAYELNATMIKLQDEMTGRVLAVGRPV